VWGKLTDDPGVEVVPFVCGGVGWFFNRHCEECNVEISYLGTVDADTHTGRDRSSRSRRRFRLATHDDRTRRSEEEQR